MRRGSPRNLSRPAAGDSRPRHQRHWRIPASRQSWRDLLFIHWPVAPGMLEPLIPRPLVVDRFGGDAYVGIVPFQVEMARPAGIPPGWGIDFPETNVRTYVTLEGHAPGVYFFSLDAASRVAVRAARAFFGLPYFFAVSERGREGGVERFKMRREHSDNPVALGVQYRQGAPIGMASPDSREFFLIERYSLYVERLGGIQKVEVRHRPYPLRSAELIELDQTLTSAAGIGPLAEAPAHVTYSPGVDVTVFTPRRAASRW